MMAESGQSGMLLASLEFGRSLKWRMANDTSPDSEFERFDPEERAAMKQALRDKDREDLRSGRATAEIHKRDLFHGQLDMSRARIIDYGPGSGTSDKMRPRK